MINIIEKLVDKSKYDIKCPYGMTAEYITIHNTYNDASAINEVSYMINNNDKVSYHMAIDDKQGVLGVPFNRTTWNAGDGRGNGNMKSISIEICYSKSGGDRFYKAEENTAEYVAFLLKQRGWGIDRVRTHKSWSGKYCPHRTLDMGWQRFLDKIKKYMDDPVRNDYVAKLISKVDNAPIRKSMSHTENNVVQFLPKGTEVDLKGRVKGEWGAIPQGYINILDFDFEIISNLTTAKNGVPLRRTPSHTDDNVITFLGENTVVDVLEILPNSDFVRLPQGYINKYDCK